ncbi:Uma2 family endonuclease [Amycolatopsis anabasis]|uniref:Uma2 family endonuclease n=1 Tax=Amycolatopsis anabasis TaxID=1840409 RepID=UPI001FE35BFD|nr:Uma2 family endonuclease [Amycolatopsis anabasis]
MATPADIDYLLPKHHGEWTVEDVLALPEDNGNRIELVDGALLVTPAPTSGHQRLLHRLQLRMDAAVPPGTELLPGVNIRLGERRLLIPDFVVVTCPGVDTVYFDAADVLLAAEIESPSTKVTDRVLKRELYADCGVPYYLLVNPAKVAEVVLFELASEGYKEIARSQDGKLELIRPFAANLDLNP